MAKEARLKWKVNNMWYFIAGFALSLVLTGISLLIMPKFGLIDTPDGQRKKHLRTTPLGGGLAIFLAFWVVVGYVATYTHIFGRNLNPHSLWGVFFGSLLLLIVGLLDDKYKLGARVRLLFVCLAVLFAMVGGVGLDKITNPMGGVLSLDKWQINTELGTIFVVADLIVFLWIMGMTYTVKILDGLDGLATGIAIIGALVIYAVASGERWHQPDMALLALIFVSVSLGFLVYNFSPAKIFLGESGSLFLGFILGILAVISGGKIATALLVMAVPVLDLVRVILIRKKRGQPIFQGDREHLHFWLQDQGIGQRKIVLTSYLVAGLFGFSTLFLQSSGKLLVLIFIVLIMGVVATYISKTKKYGR